MNTEQLWWEKLIVKYPHLFKELKYIECSEGWDKIIDELCSLIERHILHDVPADIKDQIFVLQIKEKFGGLRFYMSDSTPYIDGAIRLAENLSYLTCENCGLPSTKNSQSKGWIRSLCKKCYIKFSA